MKNILVLAYAISPHRGSEYSVAWNYVINMSKSNKLTVLYGVSGNHMGDISDMEDFLNIKEIPNVKFIAVKPNRLVYFLNILNKNGIFVYSFYLALKVWNKIAYRKALEIVKNNKIDLIHFVGPIGYREPGYLWKIKKPYVWGPIGGTNNMSLMLAKSIPLLGKIKLVLRSIVNTIQFRYSVRVSKAIKNSTILISSTIATKQKIKNVHHKDSVYLPENAISGNICQNILKFDNMNLIILVWIGRVDANKSLKTLLKALTKIKNKDKIRLNIVGDGNLVSSLKDYCLNNDIDSMIVWHGSISRDSVFNILSESHLHIITSVLEANTTVIWEAMQNGVPTMSLDHCGMHDTICSKCGIKIPVIDNDQIVNDITSNLNNIIDNPSILKRMSDGTIECAKKYTWNKRIEIINDIYDLAIDKFNVKYASND